MMSYPVKKIIIQAITSFSTGSMSFQRKKLIWGLESENCA
jgi:hypothetical protein